MDKSDKNWDIVIQPKGKRFNLNLSEVWRYKDLVYMYVHRDIVTAYKQTILGPLWYFINPIFATIMQVIVFSKIANMSTDGVNPILFYLGGGLLWTYFSACLNSASSTFSSNASVFSKVYFPRLVVPISSLFSNLIRFGIQLLLFAAIYCFLLFSGGLPVRKGISTAFTQSRCDLHTEFSGLETYSFADWSEPLGSKLTDDSKAKITDAFEKGFTTRKMTYAKNNADVMVTFYVVDQDSSVTAYNKYLSSVGYDDKEWSWGKSLGLKNASFGSDSIAYENTCYKKGNVIASFYSTKTKSLIWQGVLKSTTQEKGINELMSSYPARVSITIYALTFPLLVLMLAGLGMGLGIIVSSLTTKYRDVGTFIGFFINLWYWVTPVVYPLSTIIAKSPDKVWLIRLNPLVSIFEAFKKGFFGIGDFSWVWLGYSFAFMIIVLYFGASVFNNVERKFIDTV